MKLITNNQEYACSGRRGGANSVRFTLPDGVPETLGETVTLTADNGFVLCEDNVGAWLRWYTAPDVLVLTNVPESVPVTEPAEQEVHSDPITEHDELIAMLTEQVANLQLGITT